MINQQWNDLCNHKRLRDEPREQVKSTAGLNEKERERERERYVFICNILYIYIYIHCRYNMLVWMSLSPMTSGTKHFRHNGERVEEEPRKASTNQSRRDC